MSDDDIVLAEVVESKTKQPPKITSPGFWEQLLNPLMLQRMMTFGGVLLIIGFVIWLKSIGVFANPMVVAGAIGGATLAAISIGIGLVRRTRYQLAGRGLVLLGSLALPLNLWFYDAQGLVTVAEGGHLWIPALVCCVIYAAVARALRDHWFVYAFVSGVTLTGMLFLANVQVACFWKLLPQATLLTSLGLICMQCERLFLTGPGPFSRERFGTAFFYSGLALVGIGLGLLGSGHGLAFVQESFPRFFGVSFAAFALTTSQKYWMLGLVGISTVAFLHEHFSRRGRGLYAGISAGLIAWSVLILFDIFAISFSLSELMIALAGFTLLGGLALNHGKRWVTGSTQPEWSEAHRSFQRLVQWTTGAVALVSFGQFVGQFFSITGGFFDCTTGALLGGQLLISALACWMLFPQKEKQDSETVVSSNELSSELGGVGTVLATGSMITFTRMCGWLLPNPLAILVFALPWALNLWRRLGNQTQAFTNRKAILVSTSVALGYLLTFGTTEPGEASWVLGTALLVAALNYFAIGEGKAKSWESVHGILALLGAMSVCGVLLGLSGGYSTILSFSLLGASILCLQQFFGNPSQEANDFHWENIGAGLICLGSVAASLHVTSDWLRGINDLNRMYFLLGQLTLVGVSSLLTRHQAWKNSFYALGLIQLVQAVGIANGLLDLSWPRRMELLSLVTGAALLVSGHRAWAREQGKEDPLATFGLTFGSIATVLPLGVGLMFHRFFAESGLDMWGLFHEISVILIGLVLLGTGMMCRIRATTCGGGLLLFMHLTTLIFLIPLPEQLQHTSVVMMAGGGLFFLVAMLLSIYRDWLLQLPKQIREGEGVFRVLKWR